MERKAARETCECRSEPHPESIPAIKNTINKFCFILFGSGAPARGRRRLPPDRVLSVGYDGDADQRERVRREGIGEPVARACASLVTVFTA